MATEQEAIDGLDDFLKNQADNLGQSDPSANRVLSRTNPEGISESYVPPSDIMLSMRRAVELQDTLEARANSRMMGFIKVTRN